MIDSTVKLRSGHEVAKGFVPMSRAELAKGFYVFQQQRKFRALPPPPPTVINSAGVVFDPYGNSDFPSKDTSYKGRPCGDCTLAALTTMLVTLSQATNLVGGQLNFLASTVVAWWRRYNSMCSIQNALDVMQKTPIMDASGEPWTIGLNGLIDYTNPDEIRQALNLFKAIDNGLDSSPLDAVCQGVDGFVVTGVKNQLTNYDHSTATLDVGEAGALFDAQKLALPANKINATTIGVGNPTWGVWGFIEMESYVNMVGEAHVIISSPARGDAATWDAVASADYADINNPWGPPVVPVPPDPQPVPPNPDLAMNPDLTIR